MTEVEPDGMAFDPATVKTERIKEKADYEGVRVRFVGLLGKARAAMQIDVAFGDVVTPGAEAIIYPALLDFPAPELSGYPRETVVAEKFQAMVYLRTATPAWRDPITTAPNRPSTAGPGRDKGAVRRRWPSTGPLLRLSPEAPPRRYAWSTAPSGYPRAERWIFDSTVQQAVCGDYVQYILADSLRESSLASSPWTSTTLFFDPAPRTKRTSL